MMPKEVQQALLDMQFDYMPTKSQLTEQYRSLAKINAPRKVGDPEGPMKVLNNARDIIAEYIEHPVEELSDLARHGYAEETPSVFRWREFTNPYDLLEHLFGKGGVAEKFTGDGYSDKSEYVEGQWLDP